MRDPATRMDSTTIPSTPHKSSPSSPDFSGVDDPLPLPPPAAYDQKDVTRRVLLRKYSELIEERVENCKRAAMLLHDASARRL